MLTETEESWLVKYYWVVRPLPKTVEAKHLTELEQALVRKGMAVVKDMYWPYISISVPPKQCKQCITDSTLGQNYITEYRLLDLVLSNLDGRLYDRVDRLLNSIPTARLPELVVCSDPDLRLRINKLLRKRNL